MPPTIMMTKIVHCVSAPNAPIDSFSVETPPVAMVVSACAKAW